MADHSRLITRYGLFWSEADVFWGRPNNAAQFLGHTKPITKRGTPTGNELKEAKNYGHYKGVYALYNDFQLVYVGQAGVSIEYSKVRKNKNTLLKRIRSHRNGSLANRWQHFSWFGVENIPEKIGSITALAQLEAICIALAEPRFNKQSGAFADADQVYQVPHPDADGDLETKLNRLMEQINS
jgi:hypothetical protein